MIAETVYKNRRNKLFAEMEEGVAFIPSNELVTRSNDTEHPFRQDSNFYYLTGFLEENSILVLEKKGSTNKTTLFCEEKIPEMELWTGKRLGPSAALETFDINEAYGIKQFEHKVSDFLTGAKNIYINSFAESTTRDLVFKATNRLWKSRKKAGHLPTKVHHLDYITEKLRLIKEPIEIEIMKKAIELTDLGHRVAMAKAAPGVNERDIQAIMEYAFKLNIGEGPAYGMIVGTGDNANVLHYIENNTELQDGEMILIDAGAEYKLYASDVTRTFPVNGKFTESQKRIYNEVLKAQEAAIRIAKPGKSLTDLHEVASKSLAQSLIDLKILRGTAEDLIKSEEIKKYYPHGTGHWLGLDVHDQCPYLDEQCENIKFQENMVFTVEPGLYFPADDMDVPAEYRGIGIRIEDDIRITKDGSENLTSTIPKSVEEIEAACAKNYLNILEEQTKK